VSADNGRINQQIFQVAVTAQMVKQFFKDTSPAPPGEAFVNSIPVAVFFGQKPPLRAGAGDPENGFEKVSAIIFLPDIDVRAGFQE